MIVNIRGTSGSGKSTLVKRYLDEHPHVPIEFTLSDWKKPKIVGYLCNVDSYKDIDEAILNAIAIGPQAQAVKSSHQTFILGRYETACGGCDTLSYKGAHEDMEHLVRKYALEGFNVIFEGLTVSSTITRWKRVSETFPGEFWWLYMMTPEEECLARILSRNGGKHPKVHTNGLSDYQIKYRACMRQIGNLRQENEKVAEVLSDDDSYKVLCHLLR